MAELPRPTLRFDRGSPDPGHRSVELPVELPQVGDDFDWLQRDFDSYRDAMLEELAIRFPERNRWAVADLEVVLLETLAASLDQLSDMADRIDAEASLETARRPESVLSWLRFVGIRPAQLGADTSDALLARWRAKPHEMESARRVGPGLSTRPTRPRANQHRIFRVLEGNVGVVARLNSRHQWKGAIVEFHHNPF